MAKFGRGPSKKKLVEAWETEQNWQGEALKSVAVSLATMH